MRLGYLEMQSKQLVLIGSGWAGVEFSLSYFSINILVLEADAGAGASAAGAGLNAGTVGAVSGMFE